MKLCYVYDAVHPWERGGVQRRVWELSRRLADDHDVHWYGLHYWDGPSEIERDGVTLHGVSPPEPLYVDGRRSIPQALRFGARLVGPLLRAEFDVVDCQEFPYFPCLSSKLHAAVRGATLLVTWHEVWGDYWYEYLGRTGAAGKAVERLVARLPDAHVAVSNRTRRDLAALGVSGSRLVPNGVDADAIDAVRPADEPIDLLFVGRLIAEKNPDLVVRAADELRSELPDVRCVLVGEGPERERLQRLVDDLDLDDAVDLREFRESHEELLGLMKAADAFVLPSRREGFGIAALEALACGTPVVTIRHPQNAAAELVDHATGRVVAADPAAVAEGVLDARRAADPAACVEAARRYDWDRIAERAEATYVEVLEGG